MRRLFCLRHAQMHVFGAGHIQRLHVHLAGALHPPQRIDLQLLARFGLQIFGHFDQMQTAGGNPLFSGYGPLLLDGFTNHLRRQDAQMIQQGHVAISFVRQLYAHIAGRPDPGQHFRALILIDRITLRKLANQYVCFFL